MDPTDRPARKRLSTHHITRGMIRQVREMIEANPPGWLKEQVEEAVTRPMKIVMVDVPAVTDPEPPPADPPSH